MWQRPIAGVVIFVALLGVTREPLPAQVVSVVNMIPWSQSHEEDHNAEPTLALNLTNTNRLAAAVHGAGAQFCSTNLSAILVSTNGGNTWALKCVVAKGAAPNGDFSMRFSSDGLWLYLAYIKTYSTYSALNVVRKENAFLTDIKPMTLLVPEEPFMDQPQLRAWPASSATGLVIAATDLFGSLCPRRRSPIALGAVPNFLGTWATPVCVPTRPDGVERLSTRLALNADGTAYAAYIDMEEIPEYCRLRRLAVTCAHGSVIVARSNIKGTSLPTLSDLNEAANAGADRCDLGGVAGDALRIATCRVIPNQPGRNWEFGQERRITSALSIAVDPNNSSRVFVAWGDSSIDGSRQTLHTRVSDDKGLTWSRDLIVVPSATNPTLAIDGQGRVGFAYQRYVVKESGARWETHFLLTNDDFRSHTDFLLADAPADYPFSILPVLPYIGDYMDLIAFGDTFYGVFSANNDPSPSGTVFPFGVSWSRRIVAGKLRRKTGSAEVEPSIDPFFYKITIP